MIKTSFRHLILWSQRQLKIRFACYQDFGGRSQYVDWARNTGVQTSSDDDFYTNVVVKQYYKNDVKRLKDSMETQLLTGNNTIRLTKLSAQGDDAQMAFLRSNIYSLARSGGIGGVLVWQLVAEGMESYSDGYEIDLFQTPSTSSIISQQSREMTALEHNMSRP
ncbi:Mannan endo-1,4-beta-mannosidase 2 [Sesamum angolense]|uniref:Mannan endo-1,4-beta-mannosidase 2 n=1 Tax=Sesamum angolense TaxID=2727404 RepID=A0AAE1VZ48_9LAMI|nr:Mannan endo-1,4-beta-mannosidase 2 [Sesamum angolense]KAK4401955.1 Mannan endo-1,4-beta-mannosidase 2 [Sesamum angolense]